MRVIEIKNMQKRFVGFKLDVSSLEVEEGDKAILFGKKGTGKTAIIDLLMKIVLPDRGRIRILGQEIQKNEAAIKQNIGFWGQYSGFPGKIKLKEYKSMISGYYKRWDEDLFKQYSEQFELDLEKDYADVDPKKQEEFLFALLVCRRPGLFIIDEPYDNNLNATRRQLCSLLMERKKTEGFTILMAASDSSVAKEGADQVTVPERTSAIYRES